MKKVATKLWYSFLSPTPKKWQSVRNTFGSIALALTSGITGLNAINMVLPDNLLSVLKYVIFASLTIAAYAQTKEHPIKKI